MIVERIKTLADSKNMTLAAIERYTRLSQGSIRNWNTSIPSGDKLLRVAELLETTVDFLLTGKEINSDGIILTNEIPENFSISTDDERRLIDYYRRLSIENRDYIRGEMVRLIKEQDKGNSEGYKKGVAT